MDILTNVYLQILNLIYDLLKAFGADTSVVEELMNNAKAPAEDETVNG